uniref:Uncharacterized protein n=1 Tax=Cyanothece sp. (strain PCC 7425 / ATCC 29141) TaxID=395961 RepID=B8HZ71_CYAP4
MGRLSPESIDLSLICPYLLNLLNYQKWDSDSKPFLNDQIFSVANPKPKGMVIQSFQTKPYLLVEMPPLVHEGIWNVFDQIKGEVERHEILDWYHLMENLEKVGGSLQRLAQARSLLWQGKVDETLVLFEGCQRHQTHCFCQYLRKHRHRIGNYDYLQAEEICSIGSGAVESTVKQIDRRLKISGARWKPEHVPTVLAHRCAYLNHQL